MLNFSEEFIKKIEKFSRKTALIWRKECISFAIFAKRIRLWAGCVEQLRDNSPAPLKIATFCTNSPDFLTLVLGAQFVGVTIIPLNPSYKKYEINEYISKCGANFVIISDDIDKSKFAGHTVRTLNEVLITATISPEICAFGNGRILFFSSGTTGPPKAFEYDQRVLKAQLEQIRAIENDIRFFSPTRYDTCYGVLPYFHAGGLITVLSMLYCGCTLIINERWDENEFLRTVENFGVTILFIVPPVFTFLATHPMVSNYNLSSLKTVYIGAATSDPKNFEEISKRIPTIQNLIQLYGTTECGVLLCSTGKGLSDGKTVGFPFPFVDVKISSDQQIIVKSSTGIEKQFMETGDLGQFDDNGNIMIIGRMKEMLKIRGWQVNPNEIEDVIRQVEGVQDCAVFQPKSSSVISPPLVAKVIGDENLRDRIFEHVNDSMASYKQLDDIVFVHELPRNASGKLVRGDL